MSEQKLRISFIGTGVMGGPMAGHLVKAGHALTVYNRTRAKADAWVAQHGGTAASTPAEAARDADVVLTCVGNDDDLAQVTLGRDGAFKAMRKGALFVDHTTVSARIARQLSVEADGLGLALPAGTAAVFETIGDRRLLVGEAPIGDKAKDERVDYDIGQSPAVQIRALIQDRDAKGEFQTWVVTLTNARPFDAEIEMLIPFALDPAPAGWERRGSSWVWRVRVPANDSLVQTFRQKLKGG